MTNIMNSNYKLFFIKKNIVFEHSLWVCSVANRRGADKILPTSEIHRSNKVHAFVEACFNKINTGFFYSNISIHSVQHLGYKYYMLSNIFIRGVTRAPGSEKGSLCIL